MCVNPLSKICANLSLEIGKLRGQNKRLTDPFKRADAQDWQRLALELGQSAHGRFWKEVLWEVRAEMEEQAAARKSEARERGVNEIRTETVDIKE